MLLHFLRQFFAGLFAAHVIENDSPRRVGSTWVFPDGSRLPVVAGGDHGSETIDRPDLGEIRTRCAELAHEVAEMRSAPEDKRDDNFAKDLKSKAAQLFALDAEEAAATRAATRDWEQYAWDSAVAQEAEKRQKIESLGPDAAFLDTDGRDTRGPIAEAITGSDAYREWRERGTDSRGAFPAIELRGLNGHEVRALLSTSTAAGGAGVLMPVAQPRPPVPRQMNLVMRDLIPSTTTDIGGGVPYVRETNPATNETGATAVAEGVAKAEVTMEFDDALAIFAKIAAWVPLTEEILADAPLLRGYVENRLLYMLAFREQAQILNGPGTAANIEGIMVVSGTQTQTAVVGDVPATLALSFGKVENVDAGANGVVMNPIDFWTATATRHANQFDGEAVGTAPVGAPPQTTWGVSTVRTRAMTALSALVGDFVMGAMIVDRQSATLRTADQHDNFFVLNKWVVLVEERLALPIFRPDVFVKTTLQHS